MNLTDQIFVKATSGGPLHATQTPFDFPVPRLAESNRELNPPAPVFVLERVRGVCVSPQSQKAEQKEAYLDESPGSGEHGVTLTTAGVWGEAEGEARKTTGVLTLQGRGRDGDGDGAPLLPRTC